jgi:hypothetical protein
MLFATVALGAGLSATGVVYAADDATLNQCWGELTKQFQAFGKPGLGEHANADSGFTPDPGDGGRRGVGNVSKEDFDDIGLGDIDLSDGAQGVHANEVGMGLPECDGPPVP